MAHQHTLLHALNKISILASKMDKISIVIQRINSHEYTVTSDKGGYYISKDDANMYWHIFVLNEYQIKAEPKWVEYQLEKAIDRAYEELFKL